MGWSGAAQGALGGGAAGAGIGSAIGGLPGAGIGAGIGAAVGGVTGGLSGGKKVGSTKFERKQHKKAKKEARRHEKKNMKAIEAYNKLHYGGPYGEKAYNKKVAEFQKKYGDEKFTQLETLSPEQKGVLNQVLKQGKKGLKNIRTPEDFRAIQKEKLGKRATSTLDRLMKNPGVTDPRTEAIFGLGQGGLESLLNRPSITEATNYSPFAAGGSYLENLLSNNPEAMRQFEAPEMRRFNEQVIPELIGRFGHEGRSSSAFQNALRRGSVDLGERLGRIRGELQLQGLQQTPNYAQTLQRGQEAQANIYGNAATSALNYAQAPYQSQVANANIQNEAAKTGIPLLDLMLKQQGLQNENIMNQNQQAYNFSNLGLATPSFATHYRAPSFQFGNITGGPKPALYGQTTIPQFANQPSAGGQLASSLFQPLLQGVGQAGGKALGEGFGKFFSGGTNNGLSGPSKGFFGT